MKINIDAKTPRGKIDVRNSDESDRWEPPEFPEVGIRLEILAQKNKNLEIRIIKSRSGRGGFL